jgi:hypothetical protein
MGEAMGYTYTCSVIRYLFRAYQIVFSRLINGQAKLFLSHLYI